MFTDLLNSFVAYGAANVTAGGKSSYTGLLVTVLIWIAIIYFLIVRPNKKKKKAHKEMIENLTPGKEVITIGGLKGEVAQVAEGFVTLKVDKGVRLTFTKEAIGKIL